MTASVPLLVAVAGPPAAGKKNFAVDAEECLVRGELQAIYAP